MKFSVPILVTLASAILGVSAQPWNRTAPHGGSDTAVSTIELTPRGLPGSGFLKSINEDLKKLTNMGQYEEPSESLVEKAKSRAGKLLRAGLQSETVADVTVRLFVGLKESGLINDVIKMSLTDDEVRESITQITVDLLESGAIPWEEVFTALKDSGLAVDVVKQSVEDPTTRHGVALLIQELLPQLIKSGDYPPKTAMLKPRSVRN